MNSEPIAFFITWTVYGTFLQGDSRGWRKWKAGVQEPQPRLARWHAARLNYPIRLLRAEHRLCGEEEIERLSIHRGWTLFGKNARSNHVHVVVHASRCNGATVRDQMKANVTRVLREQWSEFRDRPVWSRGGDWQCIDNEDDLEQVLLYVNEAQDRKGLDVQGPAEH